MHDTFCCAGPLRPVLAASLVLAANSIPSAPSPIMSPQISTLLLPVCPAIRLQLLAPPMLVSTFAWLWCPSAPLLKCQLFRGHARVSVSLSAVAAPQIPQWFWICNLTASSPHVPGIAHRVIKWPQTARNHILAVLIFAWFPWDMSHYNYMLCSPAQLPIPSCHPMHT